MCGNGFNRQLALLLLIQICLVQACGEQNVRETTGEEGNSGYQFSGSTYATAPSSAPTSSQLEAAPAVPARRNQCSNNGPYLTELDFGTFSYSESGSDCQRASVNPNAALSVWQNRNADRCRVANGILHNLPMNTTCTSNGGWFIYEIFTYSVSQAAYCCALSATPGPSPTSTPTPTPSSAPSGLAPSDEPSILP